ncbi:HNH endonuclease signature motif containing protein [Rariglobus hedericola]|uniref:HNH endonuclease n=1 Tax=Rariglobus hedericola TaxID=2597822 RepID=A0A556QJF5_9BACT|nr:HNH endonuclease signature motif containing protein [Rariglobus hedericola]TSJ76762.1 HNH endonuclease [Rariglobus hedericola]
MLIIAPLDLREEIAADFTLAGTQFTSVVLGKQGKEMDGMLTLRVEPGQSTARAAGILSSWLARNKSKRVATYTLINGMGQRTELEIADLAASDVGLLLAQAQEITISKKKRSPSARRVNPSARLRTKLIDEARSTCPNPDCGKDGIGHLDAHHIDGNRNNTVEGNLIMLCKTCHGDADRQLISRDMVEFWKRLLVQGLHPHLDNPKRKKAQREAPIVDGVNNGHAAKNMNVHYHGVKPPAEKPGIGTIGASPPHRSYVRYLVKKYTDWRLKGLTEMGDDRPFNPKAVWSVIENTLKFAPYKAGLESFETIVETLTDMIDRTPFGSLNQSKNKRNYHTFAEHKIIMTRRKNKNPPSEGNLDE